MQGRSVLYEKSWSDIALVPWLLMSFMASLTFIFMLWCRDLERIDYIFLSVRLSISSWYAKPLDSIVHIVSAKVLAIATIARFFPSLLTSLRYLTFIFLEYLITMCAAFTRINPSMEGPCFDLCSLWSIDPDWLSLGTRPAYDASFSLLLNLLISSI